MDFAISPGLEKKIKPQCQPPQEILDQMKEALKKEGYSRRLILKPTVSVSDYTRKGVKFKVYWWVFTPRHHGDHVIKPFLGNHVSLGPYPITPKLEEICVIKYFQSSDYKLDLFYFCLPEEIEEIKKEAFRDLQSRFRRIETTTVGH